MLKYEAILSDIMNEITQEKLLPGMKLPSIQSYASKLRCNKCTIIKAYEELEKKHIIYSIPKSGFYVTETKAIPRSNPTYADFSIINPDIELLPYKEFNHCINRAVEIYKEDLFFYGDAIGFQPLRKQLVSYFYDEQIFTSEKNVCISSGSQQALNILFQMDYPGDKHMFLIEEPTYHYIHDFIHLFKLDFMTIHRSMQGIDLEALENIFKNYPISVFYTMPRLQNPLGTSLSEKEKQRIVALANKYQVYIIEDDFLGNLNTNKKNLPLYFYDSHDKVIYVQGFSKTFMPGIRLGVSLVPNELVDLFLHVKQLQDLNTSVLEQAALQLFIESGMYKFHQNKVKVEYRNKMNIARSYLNENRIEGTQYFIPETGFYFCILFYKKVNFEILFHNLKENNVLIEKTEREFIHNKKTVQGIRISIARIGIENMLTGLERMVTVVGKMLVKQ